MSNRFKSRLGQERLMVVICQLLISQEKNPWKKKIVKDILKLSRMTYMLKKKILACDCPTEKVVLQKKRIKLHDKIKEYMDLIKNIGIIN